MMIDFLVLKNKETLLATIFGLLMSLFLTTDVVLAEPPQGGFECKRCSVVKGCMMATYSLSLADFPVHEQACSSNTIIPEDKYLAGPTYSPDCSCNRVPVSTAVPNPDNSICETQQCPVAPSTTTTTKVPDGPIDAVVGDTDYEAPTVTPTKNCTNGKYTSGILNGVSCEGATKTLNDFLLVIKNIAVKFLLPIVGTLFVIMFIIGGMQYITSAGNPTQAESGKKTLTAAIIGIVIIALSYTIIAIFSNLLGGGIS
jgi:hypothetical protein